MILQSAKSLNTVVMASGGQDATQCNISPVLFMTVEGEPMSFYLRPGSIKRELHPLIKAGGGIMCKVQRPGSILLMDPDEKNTLSESTSYRYVSIQYIHDCVEQAEQLNMDDYRINTKTVSMCSNKSPSISTGRQTYSPAENSAILKYISRRKSEIKGNRVWQQMEKEHVTTHSWQSMKSHYKYLTMKQSKDVGEAGGDAEDADGDAEEVSGDAEEVGGDAEEVSGDVEAVGGDVEAAGRDAEAADGDAEAAGGDAEAADGDAEAAGGDAEAAGGDAEAAGGDAEAAGGDAEAAGGDAEAAGGDAEAAGGDAEAAGGDAEAAGGDAEASGGDAKASGGDAKASGGDAKASGGDANASGGDAKASGGDAKVSGGDAEASGGDAEAACGDAEAAGGDSEVAGGDSGETEAAGRDAQIDLLFAAEKGPSDVQVPTPVQQAKILTLLKKKNTKDQMCESLIGRNTELQTDEAQVNTSPQTEKAPENTDPTGLECQSDGTHGLSMELDEGDKEPYTRKLRSSSVATQFRPVPSLLTPKRTRSALLLILEKDKEEPPTKRAKEKRSAQNKEAAAPEDADKQPATPIAGPSHINQQSQSKPRKRKRKTLMDEVLTDCYVASESESDEEMFHTPRETPLTKTIVSVNASSPWPDEHLDERQYSEAETRYLRPRCTIRSQSRDELGGERDVDGKDAAPPEQIHLDEDVQCIRHLMKQTNQDLISVTKALLKTNGDLAAASCLLSHPRSFIALFWDPRDDNILLSANRGSLKQLMEIHGQVDVCKQMVFLNVER
ncbi:telomeric repeat-binding factor 2-interacting protein 1 isoform X2 [Stigmatopora argus]